MRELIVGILSVLFFSPLNGQWNTAGPVDSILARQPGAITLRAGGGMLEVRAVADGIIRVRFAPGTQLPQDYSWAVLPQEGAPVPSTTTETASDIRLATHSLTVVIRKKPLRIAFLDSTGAVINEDDSLKGMSWCGTEVRVWKRMPQGEHYYGFGEKAGLLAREGHHMTMWNSDIPGYSADTDPLYQSIPFFYGMLHGRTYGIFSDNTYRSSFDMGKESASQYSFGSSDGTINYYFIYGPTPHDVLLRYARLTGTMPLPPRWSLGYQQSRWSYAPEQRVREIAHGFRSRNIPCDVLYLDIDYMDGYRIFTWNKQKFPDPKKMVGDLARDGFKIAVIVDPGIKVDSSYAAYRSGLADSCFLKYPDGRLFTGKVWPGVCAFPDFTSSAVRTWWGSQFAGLVETGIRGWWNDMNEPSVFDVPTKTVDLNVVHNDEGRFTPHARNHNIYGMQMTRATYDGVRRLLPEERPFVLTRASYAGGSRYAAAWTGDNVASWEHLQLALTMCLNFSISGQPFVGSDIGGFIGSPSGELFARWLELGVFTPLMRGHSVIDAPNKEPWVYGGQFTSINRETINLRYRLLPLIYNVMYQASLTGLPAMRPLIFEYPDHEEFSATQDEFMFGDNVLVAPVLSPGVTRRDVGLPPGVWFNYWTGVREAGGKAVSVEARLNSLPVFVKAGAVVPSQQVMQYSTQAPIDPLTLTVFCTDQGQTVVTPYYEDDGHTFDYEKGVYLKRQFTQATTPTQISFAASSCEGSYTPPDRSVVIRISGAASAPLGVTFDGETLAHRRAPARGEKAWWYDAASKTTIVTMPDTRQAFQLVLRRTL